MSDTARDKLTKRDQTVAGLLKFAPWLFFILLAFPLPILFLLFFLIAASTEAAAVYLFLFFLSGALGIATGVTSTILLLLYRHRWYLRLRDRIAANGITAGEVKWFWTELTTAERNALKEINRQNALLGDAYSETLAARLMATRIRQRADRELLKVRRRLNQVQGLRGADTTLLLTQLHSDQERLQGVKNEATSRLAKAKARLQSIEAAASRDSNIEIEMMMDQLSFSQEYLPLLLEMTELESSVEQAEPQLPRQKR